MTKKSNRRRRGWSLLLAWTVLCTALAPVTTPAVSAEEITDDWAFLNSFVPALNRTWSTLPMVNTADQKTAKGAYKCAVNAPVMGNGDMAVAVGGDEYEQLYYMRNSDFWSDDDGPNGFQGVNQVPSALLTIKNNQEPENLALKKTVACSTENISPNPQQNGPAADAVDGKTTTMWHSKWQTRSDTFSEWLMVDMGSTFTVDRYVVHHYGQIKANSDKYNTSDFQLQYSETGDPDGEWTTADTVIGNTARVTDRDITPFTARYVRLLVTKPDSANDKDAAARIAELMLISPNADDNPPEPIPYRQEEDILTAEIRSAVPFDGANGLYITSYTSANENTMVAELTAMSDKDVAVAVELSDQVLNKQNYPAVAGVDNGVLWLKRETSQRNDARFIAKTATATRVLGGKNVTASVSGTVAKAEFVVEAGKTVTVVTALKGDNDINGDDNTVDNDQHLADVKATVNGLDDVSITALKEAHRAWWKDWYLKSYVRTYEDTLDRYYYRTLYQLGTMTRAGYVNPGLHGPWITADGKGQNYSSYCSNDLGAAMYYLSLIESNRADNAKMWIDVAYDYIPYAQERARTEFGIQNGGALYPVHWTPFAGANYEKWHWGQKWLSANIAQIGEYYYKYTLDDAYMQEKIYPQMKAAAAFFEEYMEKDENGVYNFNHSATHEILDTDVAIIEALKNSSMGLGVIKRLFIDLLRFSEDLGVDADKRALWADIVENLHEIPTAEYKGVTVYATEEDYGFRSVGPNNQTTNIAQTQLVYPMNVVTRFSDPEALETAYNTIYQGMFDIAWNHGNMTGQEIYTAALRTGKFDIDTLIGYYNRVLKYDLINGKEDEVGDNGYLHYPLFTGSGSSLNSFMNNLCVQSYDEGILFFPEYPAHREAVFKNLLTLGGFLTGGEFRDGKPQNLSITSQKGGACKVFAPWADANLKITCEGAKVRPTAVEETPQGTVYTFNTAAGKTYDLAPTQEAVEPTLYGDVDESGDVTAADALMALQAATGKITLTDPQTLAADVDAVSGVSAADALLILQKATGKVDRFPVETL
ncbi:MAG: discoidin domain-containing protein [Acutalibacteraceae bacterium]|jgi:alpha-L-fucosidase 2